jgi:hypothetical protein
MRMNIAAALTAGTILVSLAGCSAAPESATTSATQITTSAEETSEMTTENTTATAISETSETTAQTEETTTVTEAEISMTLKIGEREVQVTWEDNDSVDDLKKLAASGLTIKMSMYGGFEQVGPIGQSIARDDEQISTVPGDIVLYSGDQIVVFYGSNSWAYTRLGKINMSEDELTELLGNGDVTITLSVE